MAQNDTGQAQADPAQEAATTTVIDPLDVMNSTNSGDEEISELEKYEDEIEALKGTLSGVNDEEGTQEQSDADDDEETADEKYDRENATPDPDEDSQEEEEQDDSDESEEEEEPEEEPAAKTSDRFRFKNEEDKAVAAIAKAKGVSLVEASRIYSGDQPPASKTEGTSNQESDQPKSTYDETRTRIEELEEEELDAIRLIDVDRQVEIKQELRKLAKEAEALKVSEAQAQRSHADAAEKEWNESSAKAISAYPGLNDPKSAIYKRAQELDALAKKNGDPVFNSPTKLWDIGRQAARETGTLMAQTATQPARKLAKNVTTMKPASGNARSTAADNPQGLEAKIDGLESLDDYERLVGRAG
jgi:predicted HicB family RNase H-like nuclease